MVNDDDDDRRLDVWDLLHLHDESTDPWDACFDMATFSELILQEVEEYVGPHEYLKSFMGSQEYVDFVHSIFADKEIRFEEINGYSKTTTGYSHQRGFF